MKGIILSLLFSTSIMTSQKTVENAYYSLTIPANTTVKSYQNSHELLANIDSYQFLFDGKPKYILYLMSNKLEKSIVANTENYNDFLFDIGNIDVTNAQMFDDFVKVYFKYKDKNTIEGLVYINIEGNILNRFVLMFPNKSALNTFDTEIDAIVKNVLYKKSSW